MGAVRISAGVVEVGGVEVDLETLGRDGPGVGGAGNDVGAVVDGLIGRGGGQVGEGEMAAGAGGLVERVSEGGLAGKDGVQRVMASVSREGGGRIRQAARQGSRAESADA